MKRTRMKRSQPKRDWADAEAKRGPCRICGSPDGELAHTINRAKQDELRVGPRGGEYLWVNPHSVLPLCGDFFGVGHHKQYDAGELDILAYLTLEEQLNAVRAAGGIFLAMQRLTGGEG